MLKPRQSWCPNLNPLYLNGLILFGLCSSFIRAQSQYLCSCLPLYKSSFHLSSVHSFFLYPFLSLFLSLLQSFILLYFHQRRVSLSAFKYFFLNHSLLHLFVLSFIHLFVSFPSLILTLFLLLLKIFCSFLFLLLHFLLVIHTSILLPNALPLFNNF